MHRREFIKGLALLGAGAAALPEQVAAFEHLYTVNAPKAWPLIGLDEVYLSGIADSSHVVELEVLSQDESVLRFAINAFGGSMRWVAAPDSKIILPDLRWRLISRNGLIPIQDVIVIGHFSFLDQNLKRHFHFIEANEGSIDV